MKLKIIFHKFHILILPEIDIGLYFQKSFHFQLVFDFIFFEKKESTAFSPSFLPTFAVPFFKAASTVFLVKFFAKANNPEPSARAKREPSVDLHIHNFLIFFSYIYVFPYFMIRYKFLIFRS